MERRGCVCGLPRQKMNPPPTPTVGNGNVTSLSKPYNLLCQHPCGASATRPRGFQEYTGEYRDHDDSYRPLLAVRTKNSFLCNGSTVSRTIPSVCSAEIPSRPEQWRFRTGHPQHPQIFEADREERPSGWGHSVQTASGVSVKI